MRTNIQTLSAKQFFQLLRTAQSIQPYLPFKEIAFIELLKIASYTIQNVRRVDMDDIFSCQLEQFKRKFYGIHGLTIRRKRLSDAQNMELNDYYRPRMAAAFDYYRPIERIAFVMTVRACKRYMIKGMTNEAEDVLLNKLLAIADMMKE